MNTKFFKYDEDNKIVFGYAIISKVDGVEYVDKQGDHIPEDSIIDATRDFMDNNREGHIMHAGQKVGKVLYSFPLTEEIAKSLDIEAKTYGFLIGMRVDNKEVMKSVIEGDTASFSIGGYVDE